MLFWKKKTPESEAARAQANALKFLRGATPEDIKQHWRSAHDCSAFGSVADRAYDRAYIEALRPAYYALKD